MATAGSGDVLTGIITGLLARGYQQEDACRLGMHLHGLAGDLAAKDRGKESLIASYINQYLTKAIRRWEQYSSIHVFGGGVGGGFFGVSGGAAFGIFGPSGRAASGAYGLHSASDFFTCFCAS